MIGRGREDETQARCLFAKQSAFCVLTVVKTEVTILTSYANIGIPRAVIAPPSLVFDESSDLAFSACLAFFYRALNCIIICIYF